MMLKIKKQAEQIPEESHDDQLVYDLGGYKKALEMTEGMTSNIARRVSFKNRRIVTLAQLELALLNFRRNESFYALGDLVVYQGRFAEKVPVVHEIVGFTKDYRGYDQAMVKMSDSGNVYPFYLEQFAHATNRQISKFRRVMDKVA